MVECAGKPPLWQPGAVEPAARTLPHAKIDRIKIPKPPVVGAFLPDWVEDRGSFGVFRDPASTALELPSDRAALDALGRMVASVPGVAAQGAQFGWRDLDQYGKDLRPIGALIFRNLRAWGADLPQDTMVDGDSGTPWEGWPDGASHKTRIVYAWNIGPAPNYEITQAMQVQKWFEGTSAAAHNPLSGLQGKEKQWLIFNQWGEDLTFSRRGPNDNFQAGFDLGEWFSQNQCALGAAFFNAFNAVYTAICTMVSFGAYGATAATSLAVAQAFQKALAGVAQAGLTGDWGQVFMALGQAAAVIGGIPFEGGTLGGKAAEAFLAQNKWVIDNPIAQGVIALIPSSGSTVVTDLIKRAVETGMQIKQTITVTETAWNNFKSQLTRETDRVYAQLGWDTGKSGGNITAVRDTVPWYAQGQFDMAAAAGTLMLVQQGGRPQAMGPVKAARLHKPVGLPSSYTPWIVGGLLVAAGATAAAIYTKPGRAAWGVTKNNARKAVRFVERHKVLSGVAALGVLYMILRPKKTAPTLVQQVTAAPLPAAASTANAPTAMMRKR